MHMPPAPPGNLICKGRETGTCYLYHLLDNHLFNHLGLPGHNIISYMHHIPNDRQCVRHLPDMLLLYNLLHVRQHGGDPSSGGRIRGKCTEAEKGAHLSDHDKYKSSHHPPLRDPAVSGNVRSDPSVTVDPTPLLHLSSSPYVSRPLEHAGVQPPSPFERYLSQQVYLCAPYPL
uniref:Uncharacterized protein n=1 Tax=Medicago truncatula TaxID=3880 RepID=A2Q651_MEDTR|nr:hypothetical protein MtrDRAFT_AC172744g17v1 [Medicago truncatula]